nr:hypothetical protein [Sphingopyxis sp. PET50]
MPLSPAAALLAAAPLHAQNAAATGDAPKAAYQFPTCAAYRAADAEAQQAMRTDYVLRVDWEQNRIGTADPDLIEEACWAEGTLANFKARLDEQRNAPGYAETVRKNDAIRARNRAGRASDPCYIDEPEMRHVNEDILYSAYSPVSRTIDERKERDRASCMRAVAAASDGTIDDREMAALAGDLLAHVVALDMRSAMARRAGRFDEARAARLASIELLRANNGNLGNGLRDYAALLADIGRFVEAADVMEQAARAKKPGVGINDDYLFFRLEAADAALRAGAIDDAETIIRDTIPLVGGTFRFGSPDSANAHLLFGKALDALARVRLAQGRAADAERLLASFDWFYREALVRPVGKLPHYLPRIEVALALNDVAGAEAGAALLAALPQDDFSISEVRAVRLALARVALRGARPGAALAPLDALCGEGQAGDFAGRTQCDALRARAILAADPRSPAALAAAFEAMQAANRSVAGDALARNSALAAASLGGVSQLALDYEETMRAIRAADQDIDRLLASGEVADRQRQLSARRAELVARAAQIGDTLRVKAPRYWEFRAPRAVRLDELRGDGGLLADNEALVVLSAPVDGAAGLTFAVSRRDAAWAPIDVSADELARTVRTLRRQIDPSTDTPMRHGAGLRSLRPRDGVRSPPGAARQPRRRARSGRHRNRYVARRRRRRARSDPAGPAGYAPAHRRRRRSGRATRNRMADPGQGDRDPAGDRRAADAAGEGVGGAARR